MTEPTEREIAEFERQQAAKEFGPHKLGFSLKKSGYRAPERDAVAVFLDLEGFTKFCDQRDPHLDVARYLESSLSKIYRALKRHILGADLPFPFFQKFTGDGVMFLWDFAELPTPEILLEALLKTVDEFNDDVAFMAEYYDNPPRRVRCGVAIGKVFEVANSRDSVGGSINIAARLQKRGTPMAVARKGFQRVGNGRFLPRNFTLKELNLKGIGKVGVWISSKTDNKSEG